MTVTPLQIIAPQQLGGSAATLYTSSNIKTRIDKISYCNTDNTAHQVTLYLIPLSGSAGASNTITSAYSVPAGTTYNDPGPVGQILAVGGFIQAFADTGAKVTIMAAGTQIS